MITLVHISDFHFSRAKRRDQTIVVDALVRDLKHLAAVEDVHPSIVIFSGDLVQTGDDLPLFDEAAKFLLKPVLDVLALGPEKLFLVAGNHDIQRSVVAALSEAAMQSLVSHKEVNCFLDDLLRSPGDFAIFVKRLDTFNAFAQTRPGAMAPAYEDYLTRCYSFTVDSARVAVACLNTAWRATGAPDNSDYGKLLLGERQLDIAIREVADAALRVAVLHHPFEWWAPFERVSLFRRFAESFDLVLTGHTHYADPHLRWDTSGRALISGAGCLYESREYFNGYSIIQFDEQQKSVVVLLREYYDAKRGFDKCLRLADDGKATYSLAVAAPALTVPSSVQMLDSFRRIIDTTAQQVLLSAVHSTSAPRTLAEIFVTPTLRKEPENSDAMGRPDPSASRGTTTSNNEIIHPPRI